MPSKELIEKWASPDFILMYETDLRKKIMLEDLEQFKEDKIEELELRLRMQKMHCKMFHRQKFKIWFESCWWRLISFLKLNKKVEEVDKLLVSIKVRKILDKYLPANGADTIREKLRMNLHREISTIIIKLIK